MKDAFYNDKGRWDNLLRPTFSGTNGKKCKQRDNHIVIVERVFLPTSRLSSNNDVTFVYKVVSSVGGVCVVGEEETKILNKTNTHWVNLCS